MDRDSLLTILQNPEVIRQLLQESEATSRTTAPSIDVPVRQVPPPVVLRGELRLQVTFPYEVAAGQSYEALVEKVYAVLNGQGGPWLPEVLPGELRLWREEIEQPGRTAAGINAAPVSSAGYRDDGQYAWDFVGGDDGAEQPGRPGPVTAGPHDYFHDNDSFPPGASSESGEEVPGFGGGGPPEAGGPGWAADQSAGGSPDRTGDGED